MSASDVNTVQQAATAESALDALRAEIAERDELFALAAHELRNPLHALTLQLNVACSLAAAQSQPELVDRLKKAQATLARYVDRVTVMLELATLNGGAYPVHRRRVDVVASLSTLVDSLLPEARFREIELRMDSPGACWVRTDPLVIEQIVQNLVSNALKHSGGRLVRVSIRPFPLEDGVEIEVSDDGRGIAEADSQRVFGKFAVADGATRAAGAGLGLWIIRKLVGALQGSITLERSPEGGCLFRLQVPAVLTTEAHS